MPAKNRRKRVLVDRQIQGTLGLRIVTHWVLFFVVSVSVTAALRILTNVGHTSGWELASIVLRDQIGPGVVLLALLPWFVLDSLKLSNRFAGPMVRLRGAIRQLTSGEDVPPVTFRKGDFWREVADDFNLLRQRVLADRAAQRDSNRAASAESSDAQEDTLVMANVQVEAPDGVSLPSSP